MIYNGSLCYQLFASLGALPAAYSPCVYTDNAPYASVFNPGLAGPPSALVWANATAGILPSAGFCECASGYGDPQGAGYCTPISGSNALATVDPLAASPAATLVTSSVQGLLLDPAADLVHRGRTELHDMEGVEYRDRVW